MSPSQRETRPRDWWRRLTPCAAAAVTAFLLLPAGLASALPPRAQAAAIPQSAQPADAAALNEQEIENARAALAGIVQEETVAGAPPEALERVHEKLRRAFPRAFSQLRAERIGTSLLLEWTGRSPGAPWMLLAHLDVVPVENDTAQNWAHPPFSGKIAAGAIWGRGTLDDKASAVGILAAIESLLADGYVPRRTLLVGLGGDEETGGTGGAAQVAATLRQRGIAPEFLLDEGYAVIDGSIVGVKPPVAMVGLAEKGYLTLRLQARAEGGHSSMPPPHSAIGRLARAVVRLEEAPLPSRLAEPMRSGLAALAPHMSGVQGLALRAMWLTSPLVRHLLEGKPATAAQIRTTTAVTMIAGGVAENVLPEEATATVNFRLLPGDTADGVIHHVRRVVDDDAIEIEIATAASREPTRVSSTEGLGWDALSQAIATVFPEAVIAPGLTLGGTDAKHFEGVARQVYRFVPMRLAPGDLPRVHGLDERIPLASFDEFPAFYSNLIQAVDERSSDAAP